MADESISLDDHAKDNRVIVAIRGGRDDAQAIAAGLAFHPKLLASSTPKSHKARVKRPGIADGVEEAEHQDLPGCIILHYAWNQAIHLIKIYCRCVVGRHHLDSLSYGYCCMECVRLCRKHEKARGLVAGGLFNFAVDRPLTLAHSSPPAWSSRDDGDDDDGGEAASERYPKQAGSFCQLKARLCRRIASGNWILKQDGRTIRHAPANSDVHFSGYIDSGKLDLPGHLAARQ